MFFSVQLEVMPAPPVMTHAGHKSGSHLGNWGGLACLWALGSGTPLVVTRVVACSGPFPVTWPKSCRLMCCGRWATQVSVCVDVNLHVSLDGHWDTQTMYIGLSLVTGAKKSFVYGSMDWLLTAKFRHRNCMWIWIFTYCCMFLTNDIDVYV